MEKNKFDLAGLMSEAGKGAAELFNKTKETVVKAVDRNGDGNFDMADITAVADKIGTNVSNAVAAAKKSMEERSATTERAQLQPFFREDIENADFLVPKLVRIAEMDRKRAESIVCKGSIGYFSAFQDIKIISIFRERVSDFGLTFYPDIDSGVYYVDPVDRDRYIALDDYYSYLKNVRITELQKIAQDLGAKHFRVTYKEKNSNSSEYSLKLKADVKSLAKASGDGSRKQTVTDNSTVEIAAEDVFPGHAPTVPHLRYLQHEPSVQNLVAMRMDENSPIMHQKFTLKLSNSSGIKENDAVKINAALKALKFTADGTFSREAQKETCRYLEYEIDF